MKIGINDYYQSVLTQASMDNQEKLDRLLQQLIQEALQYPLGSQGRSDTVYKLIALAEKLPCSKNENTVDKGLRPYYDKAREEMEKGISQNIEKFPGKYNLDIIHSKASDIRKCFERWYNHILWCRSIEMFRRSKKNLLPQSLDEPIREDTSVTRIEMTANINVLSPMEQAIFDENKRKQELLFEFIRKQGKQILQNCFPDKVNQRPDCNCWEIFQRRLVKHPPDKWSKIVTDLNISHGTISTHWKRRCKPLLREIFREFGFEGE